MQRTTVIATLTTHAGAVDVTDILEANGIRCAVEEPASERFGTTSVLPMRQPRNHYVVVAEDDAARAREALQGLFASTWFLLTPDGRPYHSFEAATVDVLRAHAAGNPDGGWSLRDAAFLADEMERNGWTTVYQAFHERHRLHERERLVAARTLDDWARACGCGHLHSDPAE
jgi:hypothetical protein